MPFFETPEENRTGFIWIYGIVVFFSLGLIELVIMPAITNKVIPAIKTASASTMPAAAAADVASKIDWTWAIIHYTPYLVAFSIFVYLIVSIFLKERNEYGY